MEVFGDRDEASDADYAEVDPTRRYMRVRYFWLILIDLSSTLICLIHVKLSMVHDMSMLVC